MAYDTSPRPSRLRAKTPAFIIVIAVRSHGSRGRSASCSMGGIHHRSSPAKARIQWRPIISGAPTDIMTGKGACLKPTHPNRADRRAPRPAGCRRRARSKAIQGRSTFSPDGLQTALSRASDAYVPTVRCASGHAKTTIFGTSLSECRSASERAGPAADSVVALAMPHGRGRYYPLMPSLSAAIDRR
jgi:hypothetical protein